MHMRIILVDNYDSFTYNLYYIIKNVLNRNIDVVRNDKISIGEINKYSHILLSPGPGLPDDAGITKDIIKIYGETKSILGICLGHQAIAEVYGSSLVNMEEVKHGICDRIYIRESKEPIFQGLNNPFNAGRYHSWIVDKTKLSSDLIVTSEDKNGEIMSIKHKIHKVYGVQFHPESIMTPDGAMIIKNWLSL